MPSHVYAFRPSAHVGNSRQPFAGDEQVQTQPISKLPNPHAEQAKERVAKAQAMIRRIEEAGSGAADSNAVGDAESDGALLRLLSLGLRLGFGFGRIASVVAVVVVVARRNST